MNRKKLQEERKAQIKIRGSVRDKVAKKVIGTTYTIGGFFEDAALDKLKSKPESITTKK